MKIFKKQTIENLSVNDYIQGEVIITKSTDRNYSFEINVFDGMTFSKEANSEKYSLPTFNLLGVFPNLNTAIGFGNYYESNVYTYEYYIQTHSIVDLKEGGTSENPDIQSMGDLGWELCGIAPSFEKENRHNFIYKRINPGGPFNIDKYKKE